MLALNIDPCGDNLTYNVWREGILSATIITHIYVY